jgi:hypothetical protein
MKNGRIENTVTCYLFSLRLSFSFFDFSHATSFLLFTMTPNAIVAWIFTSAFVLLILAAVVFCRYLLRRQPHTTDMFGFIDMTILAHITTRQPLADPTTLTNPDLVPTYLDISALRSADDTQV